MSADEGKTKYWIIQERNFYRKIAMQAVILLNGSVGELEKMCAEHVKAMGHPIRKTVRKRIVV